MAAWGWVPARSTEPVTVREGEMFSGRRRAEWGDARFAGHALMTFLGSYAMEGSVCFQKGWR